MVNNDRLMRWKKLEDACITPEQRRVVEAAHDLSDKFYQAYLQVETGIQLLLEDNVRLYESVNQLRQLTKEAPSGNDN